MESQSKRVGSGEDLTKDVAYLTRPDKIIIPLMLEISDHFPDYGLETYDRYVVEAL